MNAAFSDLNSRERRVCMNSTFFKNRVGSSKELGIFKNIQWYFKQILHLWETQLGVQLSFAYWGVCANSAFFKNTVGSSNELQIFGLELHRVESLCELCIFEKESGDFNKLCILWVELCIVEGELMLNLEWGVHENFAFLKTEWGIHTPAIYCFQFHTPLFPIPHRLFPIPHPTVSNSAPAVSNSAPHCFQLHACCFQFHTPPFPIPCLLFPILHPTVSNSVPHCF